MTSAAIFSSERPTLGTILETARLLKGHTKEAAIREMGITRITLLRWLEGAQPSLPHIATIVDYTNQPKAAILAAAGYILWSDAEQWMGNTGNSVNPGSLKSSPINRLVA